jgi:dTDP-4-amino-4,6-dideoxygalactose transaminase
MSDPSASGVRYSPLAQQFADPEEIFDELRELVKSGDFTLGKVVAECEELFAQAVGSKYAIGVGSGTDALKIPLKALGVGPGDEVITAANTFWATVGAINEVGAAPVFVDCDDSFCIDADQLEAAITPRTKALMPVHLTGDVADMPRIMEIAQKHGLPVVEDACQSLTGTWEGRSAGTFGIAGGFSMHPLKIINVWGDAGMIVTDDPEMDRHCRLLRNHGLVTRDEMEIYGYNSRLDSVQAVVGKWIVRKLPEITEARIDNARYLDEHLAGIPGVTIPPRNPKTRNVYLLYVLMVEDRDAFVRHCLARGVEAKVHYPIPVYRQKALLPLGLKEGDFPVTDRHTGQVVTFPIDQHLTRVELDRLIETVRSFYIGA